MWYRIKDGRVYDYSNEKYADDCLYINGYNYNDYVNDCANGVFRYIVDNGKLIQNPEYDKSIEEKEKTRIASLTCTKRVLALALKQLGISYTQLKELIATDENAQLEWDLCERLERSNPLIDIMGSKLGLDTTTIDKIFRVANGEKVDG